tara:strand:- start:146 stop:811 length:666 start_codon:yes stop_codon:yes gene_type:complete
MATKNFVPRATGQGQIGTTSKKWLRHNAISGSFTHVSASVFQVTNLLGDISGSTSSTGSFGRLEVAGNSSLTGDLTIGGNITIGDADTDSLSVSADLTSNLIPNASDSYNLGSATKRWNNLFLSGSVSASGGPHHFEGNVGLGNYAPPEVLTVKGDISASGDFHGLSGTLTLGGHISGSATSTGSFGRVETAGNINTVGRIYESGTSVIDHATAMAIVFGG